MNHGSIKTKQTFWTITECLILNIHHITDIKKKQYFLKKEHQYQVKTNHKIAIIVTKACSMLFQNRNIALLNNRQLIKNNMPL